MPNALIVIQDEVNVRFLGIPKGITETARAELTYYVPNYIHMPSYKIGRWDGRISLMSMTGKTYLNLVDAVIPIFEAAGYSFEIEDNRKDWSEDITKLKIPDKNIFSDYTWDDGTPIVLRDYQINAVIIAMERGQGLLEMSTGSGKTLTCAAISKIYSEIGNVVVIVPNIDLIVQTQSLFKRVGIDAGIWYGEVKDNKQVTISTWQSLQYATELMIGVSCVICDEAHLAKADTLTSILSGAAANVPFRFGCTGTVPKEDIWKQQITGILGPIIFQLKAWELQELGVLASAEVIQITLEDSRNPEYIVDSAYFEDWTDQINWFFANKNRMQTITSIMEDSAEVEGNLLALIPFKKHGITLQNNIDGARRVDGDIRGKKRMEVYKEFNESDNDVLIATFGVASTGIDIPRIYVLCFIEPGKKFEKVIQSIGRGLRKAKDKDHIIIIDFATDAGIGKKHATARRKLYKEAKIPCFVEKISYENT